MHDVVAGWWPNKSSAEGGRYVIHVLPLFNLTEEGTSKQLGITRIGGEPTCSQSLVARQPISIHNAQAKVGRHLTSNATHIDKELDFSLYSS